MKHIAKIIGVILFTGLFTLFSCGDDDSTPASTYDIIAGTITEDNYTGGGTLTFEYSIDDGTTYSATVPTDLLTGEKVWIRISDGTNALSTDDFEFDWTGSTVQPADANVAVAEFTFANSDITINMDISDIIVLVIIQRDNGQVKEVDISTGATSDLFKFSLNSTDVTDLRSFIYHPVENSFYASTVAGSGGELLKINTDTRVATIVNDNPNDTWSGMADLAVLSNNNILSTVKNIALDAQVLLPFNGDGVEGTLVEFTGTTPTAGMGLVIDGNGDYWIGDYPGELHKSDAAGVISSTVALVADASLPSIDLTESYPQNLAWGADNVLYGTIFDDTNNVTYIVEIDPTTGDISEIADLGAVKHHGLAGVPRHTL